MPPNLPPVARVRDASGLVGETISVSGAASSDPEGAPLTFAWTVRAEPTGSAIALEGATADVSSFRATHVGVYAIDLVVSDGELFSPPATALVMVGEDVTGPTANAGPDASVAIGFLTTLDGSASSDPDGLSLSYEWTMVMRPSGSAASLIDADTVMPTFRPDVAGTYVVSLVVDNGVSRSMPDTVNVMASTRPPIGDAVRRGEVDAAEVYLAGTLSEGACYVDALAHWSEPSAASVGFDCYFDSRTAVIAPGGRMLYVNVFEDVLREYHCDGCPAWRPGDTYPSSPLTNDTILPTPPCDPDESAMALRAFQVSPDGQRIHSCGGAWYDEAGTMVAGSLTVLSFGWAGRLLLEDAVHDLATRTTTPVTGIPSGCNTIAFRAGETTGFLVAVGCTLEDRLYLVAHDGAATLQGAYPPPPAGYPPSYEAALAADRSLVQFAGGPMVFEDTIIRRTLDGVSEVVYTEEMTPPPAVMIHISALVTGP